MNDNLRIKDIIRDEIKMWALDSLKKKDTKVRKPIEETPEESLLKKEKADKEAHQAVFYAFEDEELINQAKQRYLKESDDDIQILSSEIEKFQQDILSNVSQNIIFNKQKNSKTIYAYDGLSGTEVVCSGFIPLNSENKIKWELSLQNGAYIEVNAELNNDLVSTLGKLNDYYIGWKSEWQTKFAQ